MNLLYAILAGLLPSIVWLLFWSSEDRNPEPRSLLAKLFLGGMAAVFLAALGEHSIQSLVGDVQLKYTLWAILEELLKFIVVAIVALPAVSNDEPIDAMMYFITVALGFAALENILFIMGPMASNDITRGIITGNLRFMGATLVHVVSSAFIGFTYGYVFYRSKFTKTIALLIGLGGAFCIHALFNLSIINADSIDTLKSFAWIWGAVVILIILFEEIKAVRPKLI
jgi:RsiW-degrading membrane proteinase PrsW (M82 family)